ncbi:hypothetical protein [Sulfurifustis variabilis]|nr:hypothetical protein [Sulfurifustis variabilis]
MKYLREDPSVMDADDADDRKEPTHLLEMQVEDLRRELIELPAGFEPTRRADLLLQLGRTLLRLEKTSDAWDAAREAFDIYTAAQKWEEAVQCCDVLFASDQPQSLAALGQGIWLAVTFPVDPELTVAMLQHVIDETPPDSQGAAVAAIVAHYVVDLRAPDGKERENLLFYTNQMLATVARRQGDVHDQAAFDQWFKRLELNDPARFLPRLRNVVDVLVQSDWWIDRDALTARLPVQ